MLLGLKLRERTNEIDSGGVFFQFCDFIEGDATAFEAEDGEGFVGVAAVFDFGDVDFGESFEFLF